MYSEGEMNKQLQRSSIYWVPGHGGILEDRPKCYSGGAWSPKTPDKEFNEKAGMETAKDGLA